MGFPHPGTGQSMRRIRYKSGNIQSIIMLSFSLLSFAIMLVTVVVMYIKFADASQDSIIESNHKVMDQTIDSVESYLVNMRQVSDAAYYNVIKEFQKITLKQQNGTKNQQKVVILRHLIILPIFIKKEKV